MDCFEYCPRVGQIARVAPCSDRCRVMHMAALTGRAARLDRPAALHARAISCSHPHEIVVVAWFINRPRWVWRQPSCTGRVGE